VGTGDGEKKTNGLVALDGVIGVPVAETMIAGEAAIWVVTKVPGVDVSKAARAGGCALVGNGVSGVRNTSTRTTLVRIA